MVRDFRYIIKRIIIGVGIALVMQFLRGGLVADVHAQTYQGVKYYSDYDLSYSNSFPTTSKAIVDFNFHHNLDLPDDANTTYLINIPTSFLITYGALQWYVGQNSSYETMKDVSFQYYIVGNYGQRWIPGTFTNGMLQWYVPGGTQLHRLVIYFTTPDGISGLHNAHYSISLNSGITYYKMGSNEQIINAINNQSDKIDNINNNINNTDTNEANNTGSSFFDNFQSDSHGLSGIISSPLRLINSLATSSCSALVLPLPFVNQNATLPCMSTVYNRFPTFYNLWQLITTGLIGYWVTVRIFGKIKDFQSPDDDRIEVLDL